jgi:hypothetical protein
MDTPRSQYGTASLSEVQKPLLEQTTTERKGGVMVTVVRGRSVETT